MINSTIIKKLSMAVIGALSITSLGLVTESAQALTLTPTSDGEALVNEIMGPGITIVPGSINYSGATGASGTFTDGLSSGLGFDKGIVLTTGSATDAAGPNSSDRTSTNNRFGGDSDLDSLIPGASTVDTTFLEFEFESKGGDLFFDFVFASEEYNEFAGFKPNNDVFGFFLDGVNIALVPGTSTPVSIDNVNSANNSALYNNNDPSDLGFPTPFNIEYDGFTKVLTAKALGLTPGKHKIKLAIADAGDPLLDSAVFIKASSFSDRPTESVPEPASVLGLLAVGALGASSTLRRKKSS